MWIVFIFQVFIFSVHFSIDVLGFSLLISTSSLKIKELTLCFSCVLHIIFLETFFMKQQFLWLQFHLLKQISDYNLASS